MIYVDASVLVALTTFESTAALIADWIEREARPLISGDWCVTEVASAIALKQRTKQITEKIGDSAWTLFNELCDKTLRLIPIDRSNFIQAANLIRKNQDGLRSGDALHLALALQVQASALATLDARLAKCAASYGLQSVKFDPQ